jgi:DNA-directed RNA polymerase subunit M/transcription elongation factor TFIIS
MVFKGCHRCSGDMWEEEDITSGVLDLVCLQCGYREDAQPTGLGLSIEDLTSRRRQDRRSRVAA